ncbi:N-acetylneuraminate lyase B-like [Mizuhopecten yessoensis]|uniref:N-acetylneuraminate lyase n=1 Tax=Mizuhopecten yessoensis TaxID=6573 RepID=A0A210PLX9_MIZYE|nr:N-acetylneuraminate lyase B-like [Mizuhopecten yessoensis]OWF37508.1 N-acetylneuraminate lyase [Mizuhopecten yessoensis]
MGEQQKFRDFRIKGIVSAPFTPFKSDGDVNYDLFPAYAKYLQDHHFQHAFVNGTLAEGMSQTIDERKETLEAWMKAADGKIGIIAHVGTNNLRDAKELARHAEKIGVEAIAALAPSFYKPKCEEDLVDYMAELAAAAPNTPFYYYCINFVTGIYLNSAKFLSLAKDRIPTLCGLKHSSRELTSAHSCNLVDKDRFQVLMGTDVQYITALSVKIEVPVTASYLGDIYFRLKSAYDKGDKNTADEIQETAQLINDIRGRYGGDIPVAKKMFSIVSGIDVGPVRMPMKDISKEKEEGLRKELLATGCW